MDELDKLVAQLIVSHEGGQEFFEHLDAAVKNRKYILSLLLEAAENETIFPKHKIIVSGKFGEYFFDHYVEVLDWDDFCVFITGGLRSGYKHFFTDVDKKTIKGSKFIFFDDSFYSGRTRDAVAKALKEAGGELVHTFVVYDGAKEKPDDLTALYSYYRSGD